MELGIFFFLGSWSILLNIGIFLAFLEITKRENSKRGKVRGVRSPREALVIRRVKRIEESKGNGIILSRDCVNQWINRSR